MLRFEIIVRSVFALGHLGAGSYVEFASLVHFLKDPIHVGASSRVVTMVGCSLAQSASEVAARPAVVAWITRYAMINSAAASAISKISAP